MSSTTDDSPVRWPADRPIPITVRDIELMSILGFGRTRFYERKGAGDFTFLELRPQLRDSPTLYCGRLVDAWVGGTLKRKELAAAQALIATADDLKRAAGAASSVS